VIKIQGTAVVAVQVQMLAVVTVMLPEAVPAAGVEEVEGARL
jgi:hypothetical protein